MNEICYQIIYENHMMIIFTNKILWLGQWSREDQLELDLKIIIEMKGLPPRQPHSFKQTAPSISMDLRQNEKTIAQPLIYTRHAMKMSFLKNAWNI